MATVILTIEEAGRALLRHRATKARANFLFESAMHNTKRCDRLWNLYRAEHRRERSTRLLSAYEKSMRLFVRRMHDQRDLLIEVSTQLYLQG